MKKIIPLLFVFTLARSQSYEVRSTMYPKISLTYDIGDASHYWRNAYISMMYGHVKFDDYPLFYRGAVVGQYGVLDGTLRFDKALTSSRGWLSTNDLTGYRSWKFPDTSGTLALAESYDASHPDYTIINARYIQAMNLAVTGTGSTVHIPTPGVFIGNYDAMGIMGESGSAVVLNRYGLYGYSTADAEAPTQIFRIDQTGASIGGVNFDANKIWIGAGSPNTISTPFYVDGNGVFAISNKLYFDGDTTLTFSGTFNAGRINAGVSLFGTAISGGSLNIGGVEISDERGTKILMTDGETGDVTTITSLGIDLGQEDAIPYYAHFGAYVGPSGENGVSLGVSGVGIDTKLYRSGANALTTPGSFTAANYYGTWSGNAISDAYISSAASWNIAAGRLNQAVTTSSSPTFAGANISGLTASRFVTTDASKNLVSFDLFGTANTWSANQAITGSASIGGSISSTARATIKNGLILNALEVYNSRSQTIAKIDSSGGAYHAGLIDGRAQIQSRKTLTYNSTDSATYYYLGANSNVSDNGKAKGIAFRYKYSGASANGVFSIAEYSGYDATNPYSIPTTLTDVLTISGGVTSITGKLVSYGMPADSTGLAAGTLWIKASDGTVHRKF